MLRWAAEIAAQREQRSQRATQPATAAEDTARMQANRAAVAANEAYKAGDLDRAAELTEQAGALDPSRAGLWQQHRDDIAARRLIISARAAHAEGDRERAGKLLRDARELDPRLRTLWDGNLTTHQAARQATGHDTAAPAAGEAGDTGRVPATAQPGERAAQRAWPSAPARPGTPRSVPAAGQGGETAQHTAEVARPREPRTAAPASTEEPDANAGSDAARWPSPNPRSQAQPSPGRADRRTRTDPQAPAESSRPNPGAPATGPSADWRDQVISQARQPWEPGPSWPENPAIHRTTETTPDAGISREAEL
jgi:hypothetical protein